MSGIVPNPPEQLLPPFPTASSQRTSGPFASDSLSGWADLRNSMNRHLPTSERRTLAYITAARQQLARPRKA